jgi:N-acetylneuraminic acid mutarotase
MMMQVCERRSDQLGGYRLEKSNVGHRAAALVIRKSRYGLLRFNDSRCNDLRLMGTRSSTCGVCARQVNRASGNIFTPVKDKIRSASAALLFLGCVITLTTAFNLPNRSPDLSSRLPSLSAAAKPVPQRTILTLADRVAYQRAIEEVYWRHRIWPKERPDPKPSLDEVMPPERLEKKVEDYLRDSQALEDYWQRPISAEQLQAEMERMAQHTKQPEVLRELFAALGNDPFVIAECLARSALSERLVTNLYAHDQRFHGELRQRAEADLPTHHAIEQMKQTSGDYSEIELVRSDGIREEAHGDTEPSLKLNSREWDEEAQKLAAMFGDGKNENARAATLSRPAAAGVPHAKGAPITQIKIGVLSLVQEDEQRYYATAILKKTKDRLKLATVEWRKEPLASWRARAENHIPKVMSAGRVNYTLPAISDGANGCMDDTWTTSNISGRYYHTAVWTGSEMIVWGGYDGLQYLSTGGRYNPSTDNWTVTSATNAPAGRYLHTAVWTGSEMIVWGGTNFISYFNTGGRYNPSTDSWVATSTTNAPAARSSHTAVWTGTEMLVWGGFFLDNAGYHYLDTGGRYNLGTDSWTATSTTDAPTARYYHTAVWTGGEMIVWGGGNGSIGNLNTGGKYNPSMDSWTATGTTNAPAARSSHTAVWTGSEMIVWGGYNNVSGLNTGGRYNPGTDSWTATSTANAPAARAEHTAVWSGSEMIVWGGYYNLNTGGRYNPDTDSWIATNTTNAPTGRQYHTAIWTGSEMIVWGGDNASFLYTGGRYNPDTDTWTSTNSPPSGRDSHTAVWTGIEMIVWGGFDGTSDVNTGGRYNPSTDGWTATSTINAPDGRYDHTAIWTGSEMIVWGGYNSGNLSTGGRYNPSTDSWTPTSITNAPTGRTLHTAVWTGSEMIIWGGYNDVIGLNTGGRYNPGTDSWTATSTTNAPTGRDNHTAVWTGSEMIVWGGIDVGGNYSNAGGRYNPTTDSWTATSTTNAPSARAAQTAVWTGSEMIVWGGQGTGVFGLNTGGKYNPGTDNWTATSTTNAPAGRTYHTAVWTGTQMVVWGGFFYDGFSYHYLNTGGRYDPVTDSWTATTTSNAPDGRYDHTAIWTGSEMIVWGGYNNVSDLNTGGRYCAQSQAPMAQSAFSRKIHGAAGTFDVPLPLTGNVGIECRSGGATNDYQMIINFANSVTVGSASVTSGTGSVSSFSVSGSQVTVNLTGVINVQRITVTLFNVNDGTHMGNVPVSMGVLVGDVNGNAIVNATDVASTKSQVGNAVSSSNFREDVNTNGTISATDVAQVKSDVGTSLPP